MIPLGPGREFDRIRRILARLGEDSTAIGDDCAVLPEGAGRVVVSTDLTLEGRHFRREWLSLEEIGWRAAAAGLSDLAAEGASALGVLVSLGMPAGASDDDAASLMAGVGAAAHSVGGRVLGGDLTAADRWIIDVTALGRAERPVSRAGAQAGDGIWVSGSLGGARAALESWFAGAVPDGESRRAFAHPEPRIALGRALAAAGARAMLDLSDGLGGDARHLAAASGVRIEVELDLVPVAPGVARAAERAGVPGAIFAGMGGEDYELLAALPSAFGETEADEISRSVGLPLTRIGVVLAGEGAGFRFRGEAVELAGYDHFG